MRSGRVSQFAEGYRRALNLSPPGGKWDQPTAWGKVTPVDLPTCEKAVNVAGYWSHGAVCYAASVAESWLSRTDTDSAQTQGCLRIK